MNHHRGFLAFCMIPAAFLCGCATTGKQAELTLASAKAPAWSLEATPDQMVIAVSPVRQTIQIAGASAAILGATIDAAANARYRKQIEEALGDYDPGKRFAEAIRNGLSESGPAGLRETAALGSTAGYNDRREAEKARYAKLRKDGADILLDLRMTYGLFGADGTFAAKIGGELRNLAGGRVLWEDAIVVSPEPVLAGSKLSDPTKTLGPNLSSPRFSAEDDAIGQWTQDGGERLRSVSDSVFRDAAAALLCALNLKEDARGEYYLGKLAMNRKDFEAAHEHFARAITGDPGLLDAQNGRAVNMAHAGQVDEAIAAASELTRSHPEYGPAWLNLAWWLAFEKEDVPGAKAAYAQALAAGMPPEEKLEKAFQE